MNDERKLTREQWDQLNIQFERTPNPDEGSSEFGDHFILISILNKFGYSPNSRREAVRAAERLLSNGWSDDK